MIPPVVCSRRKYIYTQKKEVHTCPTQKIRTLSEKILQNRDFYQRLSIASKQNFHPIKDVNEIESWFKACSKAKNQKKEPEEEKKFSSEVTCNTVLKSCYTLGLGLSLAGRHEDALLAYKQAIKISKKQALERAARRNPSPSDLSQASSLLICGKELAAPYRSGESPSFQEGDLQNLPETIFTHFEIANTLNRLGRCKEAILSYQEIVNISDQCKAKDELADIYFVTGHRLFRAKQTQSALQAFQTALKMHEKNTPTDISNAHFNIGLCFGCLEKHLEAIQAYQAAINIEQNIIPKNNLRISLCFNNIGRELFHLSKNEEALKYFETALGILEKEMPQAELQISDCDFNIGLALSELGQTDQAIGALKKALTIREKDLSPKSVAKTSAIHSRIGAILYDSMKSEEAIEHFKAILQLKGVPVSDMVQAHLDIGLCFDYQEEHEKAFAAFKTALGIQEKIVPKDDLLLSKILHLVNLSYAKL